MTTRQLVSHLGGIRHYEKNCGKKDKKDTENETKVFPVVPHLVHMGYGSAEI